jgi:hypothetical protein
MIDDVRIVIINREPPTSPKIPDNYFEILRNIFNHEKYIDDYRLFYERIK